MAIYNVHNIKISALIPEKYVKTGVVKMDFAQEEPVTVSLDFQDKTVHKLYVQILNISILVILPVA